MSGGSPPARPQDRKTRNFPRYPLDVRVAVNVFREGKLFDFWGRSTELGRDGLGVTLTGEIAPGEVVSLEFPLPLCTYPLKLRAIVRFRHGLRHGLEFLTITPDQHDILLRVCEMLASSSASNSH
jgi:PilZ domain-containing protein